MLKSARQSALLLLLLGGQLAMGQSPQYASHAPIRALPKPSDRPLLAGPSHFVSPTGDDTNTGDEQHPWRTVNAAMPKLSPGDTLYLRAGEYFENVYCAVAGTVNKPITIRAYPNELATINGGLP